MSPNDRVTLRVGTRGSALARAQTAQVVDSLARLHPHLRLEAISISTSGDRLRGPLPPAGSDAGDGSAKGLFTKEIDEALLRGEIDLAVHSLKDLPTSDTPGLRIGALPARGDPRDALISRHGLPLKDLPHRARVGTGSARRDVLLREIRPDLRVTPIRGNVDTRLRKLAMGEVDALVLAAAGLIRLGRETEITELLPPERFVPAPGQGALAIQIRADDPATARIVAPLDDPSTRIVVEAERRLVEELGGGCRLPVGAYGLMEDGRLSLTGMMYRESVTRVRVAGDAGEGRRLALQAAEALRAGEG